jgi:hypothetical protein
MLAVDREALGRDVGAGERDAAREGRLGLGVVAEKELAVALGAVRHGEPGWITILLDETHQLAGEHVRRRVCAAHQRRVPDHPQHGEASVRHIKPVAELARLKGAAFDRR